MNKTKVEAGINESGYDIIVNSKKYSVKYGNGWKEFGGKKALVDNILYARTAPLKTIFGKVEYGTSKPFLKGFVDKGVKMDIPRVADEEKVDTKAMIDRFENAEESFSDEDVAEKIECADGTDETKAVIGMSFGKDSLLSFGLAEEIGMKLYPVFFGDMIGYNMKEYEFKTELIRKFDAKFGKKTFSLADNTDSIYYDESIKGNTNEFDGTNAMLLFNLELIPMAFSVGGRYIIFGNEQNHNDCYTNNDGFKTYPSGDQTGAYMAELNKLLGRFTDNNNQQISLVEPIYNIAEMIMLAGRYKQYIPFMMSCSSKKLDKSRWCTSCPMCAKSFLFSEAAGIETETLGFTDNMFLKKYANLYPLFNKTPTRPYEKPKESRDEQLLCFYMLHKAGKKSELMDLFRKEYLEEAKEREEELRKKFLGVHEPVSLPKDIKKDVMSILKEELANV